MALNNPYALSFDGVDDYGDIGNIPFHTYTEGFTLQFIVKAISDCRLITNNVMGSDYASLSCTTFGFTLQWGNNDTQRTILTFDGNLLTDGLPHQVVFVWDTEVMKVLIDGEEIVHTSHTQLVWNSPNAFYLMANNTGSGATNFGAGTLDEMSIWNRALSVAEIQKYMNKQLTGAEPGIVAYYRCDNDNADGAILQDYTGNGNDGTIYGATYVDGLVDLELGYIDVGTLPPTDITYDSMTMNGELRDVGNYPTVDCKFQYSTDPEFNKLNDINNPYALSFDGVDDYVDCGNNSIFNLEDTLSISLQVKIISDIGTGIESLLGKNYNGTSSNYVIQNYKGNFRFFAYDSGVLLDVRYPINNLNQWYNIDVTFDKNLPSDNVKLYINGELVSTDTYTSSLPINNENFIIGHYYQDYFKGVINNVSIWNRPLSQQEIQYYMNKKLTGNEDGLVAYYRCDEGEGTTLIDATGNGNDGTIYGATYVDGLVDLELGYIDVGTLPPTDITYDSMTMNGELRDVGNYPTVDCKFQYSTDPEFNKLNDINNPYALSFDGVDDYVDCGNNSIFNLEDTLSISLQVKIISDIGTGIESLLGKNYNGTSSNYVIQNYKGNFRFFAYDSGVLLDVRYPINNLNQWYNIDVTFDKNLPSDNVKLYINGELVSTDTYTSSLPINNENFIIGHYYQDYFKGVINNVSIWNRPLSQQEIQYYMNKKLTGNEDGLVAYYRCDEGEGTTLIDATGNGNDGTIHGASYVPGEVQLELTDNVYEIQETEPQTIKDTVLSFDGVDDYITSSNLNNVELKTIEFLFNHPYNILGEESHAGRRIGSFSNNIGVLVLGFGSSSIQDETLTLYNVFNENVVGMSYIKNPIYKGKNHLALVWNGSYYDFLLNGVQVEVFSYNGHCPIQTPDFIQIGKRKGYNQYFQGTLNEIRLWNYARTQSEIKYYMNKKLQGDEEGLIAYYNCDNSNNDETTLVDITGNGNDGTIYGATYTESPENLVLPVQFSTTLKGLDNSKPYYYRAVATTGGEMLDNYNPYSLSFDGIDDYVSIPNNEKIDINLPFCIEAVVKIDNTSDLIPIFGGFSNADSSSYAKNYVYIENGILKFDQYTPANNLLISAFQLNTNIAYHITITQDNAWRGIYINGVLDASDTSPEIYTGPTPQEWAIGARSLGSSFDIIYGRSIIDEVRIWNRALSQQEIKNNMNRSLTGDEDGLVTYYRCNKEGNPRVLIDSSGNDNHGTIYGATWIEN